MSDDTDRPIRVGSSDVPPILGVSPWKTPSEAWASIVGLIPRESAGNGPQARGNLIERSLILDYRERFGFEITPGPRQDEEPLHDPLAPWRTARPDARGIDNGVKVGIDAKTVRDWEGWGQPGSDEVPQDIAAQVVWQMSVTGDDRTDIPAFCTMTDEKRIYRVYRKLELEVLIVEEVTAWMCRHVWPERRFPEPVHPRVIAALHRNGGVDKTDLIDPTDDDLAVRDVLRGLKHDAKRIQKAIDFYEPRLKAAIGDHYGLRDVGNWYPVKGRLTCDFERLQLEYPQAFETCTRRGKDFRVLKLNGEKDE